MGCNSSGVKVSPEPCDEPKDDAAESRTRTCDEFDTVFWEEEDVFSEEESSEDEGSLSHLLVDFDFCIENYPYLERVVDIQQDLQNLKSRSIDFTISKLKKHCKPYKSDILECLLRNILRFSSIRPKLEIIFYDLYMQLCETDEFQKLPSILHKLERFASKNAGLSLYQQLENKQKKVDFESRRESKKLIHILEEDMLDAFIEYSSKYMQNSMSCIFSAFDYESTKIIKYILSNHPNMKELNQSKRSLSKNAIRIGNVDIINILKQLNLFELNLGKAIKYHHYEIAFWNLNRNINEEEKLATKCCFNENIIILMRMPNVDVQMVFQTACKFGINEIAQFVLENFKIDPIVGLCLASHRNYDFLVRKILKYPNINVNKRFAGTFALLEAAKHGADKVVKILLKEKNINVNLQAFHYIEDDWKIVRENAHSSKARLIGSYTFPLLEAIRWNHPSTVALLLKAPGIEVNKPAKDSGQIPLYLASTPEIIRMLLSFPAIDVNKTTILLPIFDSKQKAHTTCPLIEMCKNGSLESLKLLVNAPGIRLCRPDLEEYPLQCAVIRGDLEIVSFLLTIPCIEKNMSIISFSKSKEMTDLLLTCPDFRK